MSHFICTFGQVLSEWMEKNCYNATSLTKKMNEKSRTVIARLMKDESGYKSCSAFWKRFRKAFPELSQTDSKRFEEGLEVEKLGLEQYQIRSLFQSQLMGPEQPERPSELGKKLNAWIGEQSCEILALGCFDTEILQAFQLVPFGTRSLRECVRRSTCVGGLHAIFVFFLLGWCQTSIQPALPSFRLQKGLLKGTSGRVRPERSFSASGR